jgi:hypothetical protein
MGLALGRQLVVVRLADGLWIHSPIPVTSELQRELAALGPVRHVVGPNCFHDECLEELQAAYPEAIFHAAPGLARTKASVRFARELSDAPDPAWTGVLQPHLVRGMPRLNEVVFLHPASRSLILADLAFNLGPDGPFLTALAMRINGVWGHFGPSRLCRSLMKDPAAVRQSLDALLAWDFDRIIVGHGRNIETNGKQSLRDAFAFLK